MATVLLLHHASLERNNIFFIPEPRKNSSQRIWNIKEAKETLGPHICKHILFLHAFLGSDTTSHIYGFGKNALMKKIKSSNRLMQAAEIFDSPQSSASDIEHAGETAMCVLYNGKPGESLNHLRYKKFYEKVSTNLLRHVQPQVLPPTAAATKFHSLRVYHQVCQWKGCGQRMTPNDWGWRKEESCWTPIETDLPPAPQELLKVIRCNCKSDCSSQQCSCKKHSLRCSLACGNCRGSGCQNASPTSNLDDETLSDEEAT